MERHVQEGKERSTSKVGRAGPPASGKPDMKEDCRTSARKIKSPKTQWTVPKSVFKAVASFHAKRDGNLGTFCK